MNSMINYIKKNEETGVCLFYKVYYQKNQTIHDGEAFEKKHINNT